MGKDRVTVATGLKWGEIRVAMDRWICTQPTRAATSTTEPPNPLNNHTHKFLFI